VLASNAVAVDWGYHVIGKWAPGFAVIVALSTFGGAVASSFALSRVLMAVGREGESVIQAVPDVYPITSPGPYSFIQVIGLLANQFWFSMEHHERVRSNSPLHREGLWFCFGSISIIQLGSSLVC